MDMGLKGNNMGQTFGNLTHSAVVSPDGTIQWQASPAQAGQSMAKQAAQTAQPSTADVGANGPTFDNPQPKQPQLATPSFLQAATNPQTGTPNALSPGLTKMGKLALILTQGAKGALAGRAAQEQMIAQTGGRRAGGFGTGFQGGLAQPYQEAEQRQQAALGQAGLQPIPLPGGVTVPAAIAPKFLSPYLGYQGKMDQQRLRNEGNRDVQGMKGTTQEDIQRQKSGTQLEVAKINQGVPIPVDSTAAQLAGFPELAGQMGTRSTWTNINKAIEAKGYRVQDMGENGTGPNQGMWLMDRAGNRIKQESPNSLTFQRGASFAQNKPETVVDPNDPGYAYYTTAAEAMRNHLPSPMGAGTVAAKSEARSEVPTKVGDQKVAFGTMIAHAQLLRDAARALNNGDSQTLSGLQNRFKNEFGWSGPVTSEAIADAYKGEVSNVINKGHITDAGNEKVAHTLDPTRQNYSTIDSVLSAYQSLAQSKLDQLNKQVQASKTQGRSTPNKPNATADPFAAFGGKAR